MRYWVYINNEILGPFEKNKLAGIAGFSLNTLVCVETPAGEKTGDWQQAAMVPEISAALNAPPSKALKEAPEPPRPPAVETAKTSEIEIELPGIPPLAREKSPSAGAEAPEASGPVPEPEAARPPEQKIQEGALGDTVKIEAVEPSKFQVKPEEYVPIPLPTPSDVYKPPEALLPPENTPLPGTQQNIPAGVPAVSPAAGPAPDQEFQKMVGRQLDEIGKNVAGLKDGLQAREDETGRLRQDIFGRLSEFEAALKRLEQSVQPALSSAVKREPEQPRALPPAFGRPQEQPVSFTMEPPSPAAAPPAQDKMVDQAPAKGKAPAGASALKKAVKAFVITIVTVSLAAAGLLVLDRTGKIPPALRGMLPLPAPAGRGQTAPEERPAAGQPLGGKNAQSLKEVVDWVKSYSAPAGSPSVEKRIIQAQSYGKGQTPAMEWKSEVVSPGVYSVTAMALSVAPGAQPVAYRFEADFQDKTIKGASPEAEGILKNYSGKPLQAAPAAKKPAAAKARPQAKARTAPAVKPAPKEEEEYEYEEVGEEGGEGDEEFEEDGETDVPAQKSPQKDFILPGIPRRQ